jgi:hypothetical protein
VQKDRRDAHTRMRTRTRDLISPVEKIGIRLISCLALGILKRKIGIKSNSFLIVYTLSLPTRASHLKQSLLLFFLFVLLPSGALALSEYSISFEDFKKKLEGVFTEGQFKDLRSHLPSDFEICGYDVGDFSGDGELDLAISVKAKDVKEKRVQVFFFVNNGPEFIEASTFQVGFWTPTPNLVGAPL